MPLNSKSGGLPGSTYARKQTPISHLAQIATGAGLMILASCASNSRNPQTPIAGGGVIQSQRSGGKFAPAENDRYAVTNAELGAIILDGQHYLRWSFALRVKQPEQLRSVRVEDVTNATPISYIADQAPQTAGGQWTGYSGAIEPNAAAIPWLYDNTTSSRVFRITITNLNNQVSVLSQTVSYSPQSKKELRKWYGLENSR
jgi:hypothetical protein